MPVTGSKAEDVALNCYTVFRSMFGENLGKIAYLNSECRICTNVLSIKFDNSYKMRKRKREGRGTEVFNERESLPLLERALVTHEILISPCRQLKRNL